MNPKTVPTISPELAPKLRDLVAQLDAAATRAQSQADAARASWLDRTWQSVTGTDSTADALASRAHSARNLARDVRERIEKRLGTDAEALTLLREAAAKGWAALGDVDALARSLTMRGGVAVVAKESAKTVAAAAVAVGENTLTALRLAPFALLAVAGLVLYSWGRRP